MACRSPMALFFRSIAFPALANVALVLSVAAADDHDPAESPNRAKNLARLNCGAHITRISGHGASSVTGSAAANTATNLLLDDNTLNCRLTKGDNIFLISLANISNLDRVTFINENRDLTGTIQLFVSAYWLAPNDNRWTSTGGPMPFGKERLVSLPLAGVEGKYVKVLFKTD